MEQRRFIILGASGFAREVMDAICSFGGIVEGFLDRTNNIQGDEALCINESINIPILGSEDEDHNLNLLKINF